MPGTPAVALFAAALVALLSSGTHSAEAQTRTRRGAPTAPAPSATVPFAGWCQCIDNFTVIQAMCQPSPQSCQSTCAGSHYSFVPYAWQSCAAAGYPNPPNYSVR